MKCALAVRSGFPWQEEADHNENSKDDDEPFTHCQVGRDFSGIVLDSELLIPSGPSCGEARNDTGDDKRDIPGQASLSSWDLISEDLSGIDHDDKGKESDGEEDVTKSRGCHCQISLGFATPE